MKFNKPELLSSAKAYTINNKCKAQKVREERCKNKIAPRCVIDEENQSTQHKNFSAAFQAEMIR